MRLDRHWISTHIPHTGSMCLLDEVLSWNASRVECKSSTHRAADNPLRAHGRLGGACGIEYAAQAVAVHGALVAGHTSKPTTGYLAGLRRVVLRVDRLDDIATDLWISGERVNGDASTIVYEFSVHNQEQAFLTGRATIVLDAARFAPGMRAKPVP